MDIIEQLRNERIKKGLRQTDVGNRAGMTAKYYGEIERRNHRPCEDTLTRLADALDCRWTLTPKDNGEDGR